MYTNTDNESCMLKVQFKGNSLQMIDRKLGNYVHINKSSTWDNKICSLSMPSRMTHGHVLPCPVF